MLADGIGEADLQQADLCPVQVRLQQLLTAYYLLTACCFLLPAYYSLLTTYVLLLTTHSLFTHYSLLTTHYSLLTTHYSLLTACYLRSNSLPKSIFSTSKESPAAPQEAIPKEGEASPKVEHVFAVGDRVRHKDRGLGTVGEHMLDGRTAIVFEGGEMHRYKQSSMHKIELVEAAPVNAQDMQTTGMSGMFASSLGVPFIDANSPSRIPAPFNIRQGAKTSDEARGEYSYRSEHSYQTEEPAVSSRSASPNIGRPRTLTREDELLRQDLIRSMSGMPQMGSTIYPPNDGLAADGASALVLRELQAMRRQIDTLTRRLEEFAPAGDGGGGDGGDGGDGGGGGNGRPPVQPVVFEAV